MRAALAVVALAVAAAPAVAQPNAPAQPQGGYYASLKGLGGLSNLGDLSMADGSAGVDLVDDTPEWVGGPSVAAGYQMKNFPVRFEGEWTWRYRFDMDAQTNEAVPRRYKNNLGTHSFMLNAYYDVPVSSSFAAYVGGGIGVAHHISENLANRAGSPALGTESSNTELSWMLSLGSRYWFNQHWALDTSYRYTDLGSVDTGDTGVGQVLADSYTSHDFLIGVAYKF